MSTASPISETVIRMGPTGKGLAPIPGLLVVLGVVGLVTGFVAGPAQGGWAAFLVAVVMLIGLAVVGVVISVVFQLTHARFGRVYRRLAEGCVVLMPMALLAVLVFLIFGGHTLPWFHAHYLSGGKAVWLVRGFWDARILGALILCYGLSLWFLYYSLRKDFCVPGISEHFSASWARWISRGIDDPETTQTHCERRMAILAPIVGLAYAFCFSLIGFDLIMALEPDWYSTLFGAWYFMGNVFAGFALLALISILIKRKWGFDQVISKNQQADLATVLFAFCLVNVDFFWSQFLTIWYGNLPEETMYVIPRTIDPHLPWPTLSWVALVAFFAIPFVALIFRRVKRTDLLLGLVATAVILGIFLARFVEIVPPLLALEHGADFSGLPVVLFSSAAVFLGFLGAGAFLYRAFLRSFPALPVGDTIFQTHQGDDKEHA